MEEEVQSGPARGRGRGGRGTRRRGRGRCANRGRGLDGLEDAAVGGGRSGAADRGGHGRGRGRGRVSNVDRQRLDDGDDYHELAALLGIPYQTTRSTIRVWLAEGRVQRLPEGVARNITLTDDMQAFIGDFVLQQPFTTIAHRRGWSGTGGSLPRHGNFKLNHSLAPSKQLITTKIAGKDSHVPNERNCPNTIERRFQYATWLISLGQYLHLPVCATSSIPSFTGVQQRQVYIDESGFNSFTRRSKDIPMNTSRAPVCERFRRVVAPLLKKH